MKPAQIGDLTVGGAPVLVATALAESVEGMRDGVGRVRIAGADCVELRVDKLSDGEVAELIGGIEVPHIVSCRTPRFGGFFEGSEAERIQRLEGALVAGATCIDIEFFAEPTPRDRLIAAARERGTPVLIGYENMQETPSKEALLGGIRELADLGPDLVKLAVRASSYRDLLTVLETALEMGELLDVPYAAVALGVHGAPSRPVGCVLGGAFTYCAVDSGKVPGQLTVAETRSILEMVSEQRWSCSSN